MHEAIFLTITALTVSVDSFLCGFSLAAKCRAMKRRERLTVLLGVTSVVTLLCTVGAAVGNRLGVWLASYAEQVGGWVLITVGAALIFFPLLENRRKQKRTKSDRSDEKEEKVGETANDSSTRKEVGEAATGSSARKEVGEAENDSSTRKEVDETANGSSTRKKVGEAANRPSTPKGLGAEAVSVGVGIGLDGAMASVTLSAMGYSPVWPVLVITACHFLLITLGIRLAESRSVKKFRAISTFAPFLLIFLGVWKLLG